MPQPVQIVKDMEIDEISLVDRAANQSAAIVIAKRADQEDGMPQYTDEDGNELDLSQFEEGDVLEAEDGQLYEVTYDDDGDYDEEGLFDESELESVGKSAFGASYDDSVIADIREELSKAVSLDDQNVVLSKAFATLSKRAEYAEQRLVAAEQVAKAERDLRLEREYISKAAEYNVPVDPEELGPVLMRATEALSYDDCAVIHKALTASGEMLYVEAGYDGRAMAEDPLTEIEAMIDEQVSKSGDGKLSKAGAVTAFFDQNPDAYDAYRAERTR
jgi:hypothetical protein